MAAIWIIVAVVVVALVVVAAVALRTRAGRRPSSRAPAPRRGHPYPAPGSAADTLREPAPAPQPSAGSRAGRPSGVRERLGRARGLFSPVRAVRGRGSVDAETWEQIEDALLRADVGVGTADALLADLRSRWVRVEVQGTDGSSTPFARTSSGSSRCPARRLRRRGRPRLGGGGPRGAPPTTAQPQRPQGGRR